MNTVAKLNAAKSQAPRILPALMVTLGVVLSLKAVAVAEAANTTPAPTPTAAPPSTAPTQAAPASAKAPDAPAQGCPTGLAAAAGLSASEVQVLQSLGERRKQIDARAVELDTKAELTSAAERRLSERLDELKRLEARVQSLLGQVDEEQARRLASLVDVYQRMRPKDAAAVFDALDEEVLVQVASRMRQQNLAEVMSKMSPDRARVLTLKLAESRLPTASATSASASGAAPASRAQPPR